MNNKKKPQSNLSQVGRNLSALGTIGCMLPIILIFGFIFIMAIWGAIKSFF